MKSKVSTQIEETLSTRQDSETLRNYKKASKKFENLVKRGIAKSRGNNSMPFDATINCSTLVNKFN